MILITYDLKSDHKRLKDLLKKMGWKDQIKGEKGITYLPNTSLWKEGNDQISAREEVRNILKTPNLERLFVVPFTQWASIMGDPFD